MLDFGPALRDGAILAVAVSAVVMGSLRTNPRLFMRHFPEALKARLPPLSPAELKVGRGVGVVLMLLLFGGPLASTLLLPGPPPIHVLFLHAFTVGMVSNLVDWLLLDELWLGVLKPRWAVPPGAEMADFVPFDHARHFRGFLTGTGLCAVSAAIAAGVVAVLG
jgi:hypothetical protein